MQTLKFLKQINYIYLISKIFKIWSTIKRFAKSQNVKKKSQMYFFFKFRIKFRSKIINLQRLLLSSFLKCHLYTQKRKKIAIAPFPPLHFIIDSDFGISIYYVFSNIFRSLLSIWTQMESYILGIPVLHLHR